MKEAWFLVSKNTKDKIEVHYLKIQARCSQPHGLKCNMSKEIVERRHGEPIKFLSLPKMGLLGSQACTVGLSVLVIE